MNNYKSVKYTSGYKSSGKISPRIGTHAQIRLDMRKARLDAIMEHPITISVCVALVGAMAYAMMWVSFALDSINY